MTEPALTTTAGHALAGTGVCRRMHETCRSARQ